MTIGVDYAGMDNVATQIRGVARKLQQDLDQLRLDVKKVSATWEGEAQTAFQSAEAQWDRRAQSMQNILESVAKRVEAANANYRTTDNRAARGFGG
ncbi:WXG100 family type VII secretion target [Streptomyces sp. OF3]|uniref:ESAT-6-like protein n=1 Tax=Streptomyces alkaliterrae TaxID=2213162 RepID=A0A7W3WP06_9ACTN|nr:WXG100 family type VII secretion target [Streptomyces alkaliterrae]MBB1255889.1 WXG100 family type VII secretion target [Streptomyces alkaliterrae]